MMNRMRLGRRNRLGNQGGAATTPWYLSGGIQVANCLYAHQPIDAASLAASYVNIANPGTYDATEGVAPAFDPAVGWTLDGTKYLSSSAPAGSKPVLVLARVTLTSTAGTRTIIGGSGDNGLQFRVTAAYKLELLQQNTASIATSSGAITPNVSTVVGFSYSADGACTFYFNGAAENPVTNNKALTARTLEIARIPPLSHPFVGSIQALAGYNTIPDSNAVAAISTAMAALSSSQPPQDLFVAPDGSAEASGAVDAPTSLAAAFTPLRTPPGATVYLREGTYTGDFTCALIGTADQRTTVRSYPGERAIIDGSLTFDASSKYVTLIGD